MTILGEVKEPMKPIVFARRRVQDAQCKAAWLPMVSNGIRIQGAFSYVLLSSTASKPIRVCCFISHKATGRRQQEESNRKKATGRRQQARSTHARKQYAKNHRNKATGKKPYYLQLLGLGIIIPEMKTCTGQIDLKGDPRYARCLHMHGDDPLTGQACRNNSNDYSGALQVRH
jgi:hypothetical protein